MKEFHGLGSPVTVCDCHVQAAPRPEKAPGSTCELPGEAWGAGQCPAHRAPAGLCSDKDDATDDKSRVKM